MNTTKKTNKHVIHLALDNSNTFKYLKAHLVADFGAYTLTEAVGGWFDVDKKETVQETSYTIIIYGFDDDDINNFCERALKFYGQTEIIYTSELITYNSITS